MNTRALSDQNECRIHRDDPQYGGHTVLADTEGTPLFVFDKNWTDEQIWSALRFANKAYRIGFANGQTDKVAEIRRGLNLPGVNQ